MCVNLGFGCIIFGTRGTRSNVSTKMEVENNMDAVMTKTRLALDPIRKHETLDLDVIPMASFLSISLFQSKFI